MKTNLYNLFENIDLLLTKLESIESKLTTNSQEHKYKEYMCLDDLLEYLKQEKALTISKSKIYKLTATSGGIPFRKSFGQLIFTKKEIDLWIDEQLNPQNKQALTGRGKARLNNPIINLKKTNYGKF